MSGNKWKAEVGMGSSECGMRNSENISIEQSAEDRSQMTEVREQIKTDMRRLGRLKI